MKKKAEKMFPSLVEAEGWFQQHGFRVQKNRYTPHIPTMVKGSEKIDLLPSRDGVVTRHLVG